MFGRKSSKTYATWVSLTDDDITDVEQFAADTVLALAKDSNAGVATAVLRGRKNAPDEDPSREIGRSSIAKVNGRWVCHLTSSPNFDGKTNRELWLVQA